MADILADLSKLNAQQAIKIPLSSLNGEKMQNLRSALNRVTREKKYPGGDFERREISVRLARRPAQEYAGASSKLARKNSESQCVIVELSRAERH